MERNTEKACTRALCIGVPFHIVIFAPSCGIPVTLSLIAVSHSITSIGFGVAEGP